MREQAAGKMAHPVNIPEAINIPEGYVGYFLGRLAFAAIT